MARSSTTGIVFILGVLATLWMFLVLGIGLFYQFVGLNGPDLKAAGMMYFCTVINVILVVVFLGYWYVRKTREDRMDDLMSFLRLHRRTPMAKAAQHLGIEERTAQKVLLACISKNLIKGVLDRNTGEFVLEESITTQRTGAKCPNCGGYTDRVVLPGEVLKCQYCDAVIPGEEPPPPEAPPGPPPTGGRIMLCSNCRREIPIDSRLCPYCGLKFG